MLGIQLVYIILSLGAVWWAFHELREERQAWEEDEAIMRQWLCNRDESLNKIRATLTNCLESHNKWLEGARANGKKLKKEISTLKGQNTRLKKKLEFYRGK